MLSPVEARGCDAGYIKNSIQKPRFEVETRSSKLNPLFDYRFEPPGHGRRRGGKSDAMIGAQT
jgi:hypothetical protein